MSTPLEFITAIGLGLIAGALGQVVRQIGSFKKLMDENPKGGATERFDGTRFGVNLMVGATAGALGVLSLMDDNGALPANDLRQTFITLIGIGYAGADFIEAFMRRSQPTTPNTKPLVTPNQGDTA
jgi:hypothetical protein